MNRTLSAPRAAPRRTSARAPRSASLATVIGTVAPSTWARPLAQRDVLPAEVRRHGDAAVDPPDEADDRDADPDQGLDVGPAGADEAREVGQVGGDLVDRGVLAGDGPPGPARGRRRRDRRARPPASRPRSRGPGRPRPSAFGRTSGDGRPGVPSGAARTSDTSPAATSSTISPRIALRVRPVRATSSERDRGPRSWSSRTIALRFARRTVSLRWPSSRTTGVCVPLFQMFVIDSYMAPAVSSRERRPDGRSGVEATL